MLKRSFEEEEFEEEESENWLASYSDLVTDLMAIFVLLFSFALLTQASYKNPPSSRFSILDGSSGVYEGVEQETDTKTDKLLKELRMQIIDAGLEEKVGVNSLSKNRLVMRVGNSILFDEGQAVIKDEAKSVLDGIADILLTHDNTIEYIHIEGHTDNRPINTTQFPSNWELSTGRACSVVRYMIEKSMIADEKFSATGYGEFRPVADNSSETGRTLNRRVEFIIELKDDANLEEP